MSLIGRSVAFAAATLLIVAATGVAGTNHREHAVVTPHSPEAEVRRIHAHFDSVLAELPLRDVRSLSASQRTQRARLLTVLEQYNRRGVFPHNYDFAETPTPYFVDRKTGTRCAVAHLLESTGRQDIVDRVAQSNNNVWVAQLAGDIAFGTWLDENGLTLAEAARIQVPYSMPNDGANNGTTGTTKVATYAVGAPIALLGTLTTGIWNATGNADGHRKSVAALGILSGLSLSVIGGMVMAEPGASGSARGVAGAGTALGGLTMALSVRGLQRHGRLMAAKRDAAGQQDRRRADPATGGMNSAREPRSAELVPLLSVGRNASAGAAMTIRF